MSQVQSELGVTPSTKSLGKRPPAIRGFDAEGLFEEEAAHGLADYNGPIKQKPKSMVTNPLVEQPTLRLRKKDDPVKGCRCPSPYLVEARGPVPEVFDERPPTHHVVLTTASSPAFEFEANGAGFGIILEETPLDAPPINTLSDVKMEVARFEIPIAMAQI